MALFQPTNIFPDLKGGVKNGVVFYVSGGTVNVSWTVNGNSPLYAYQIDFYKNDADSTYTGTTGKITLGTPFSAIDADGNETRFTAAVAQSLFGSAMLYGTWEGKFKITQWWSNNASDYVEQRSLSVFKFAGHSTLGISGPVGYGGSYTFTGTFTPSNLYSLATLNWTRWQLFSGSDLFNPIQDTGKVWGATSYSWTPTQIAPGTNYTVKFSAETSFGEEISVTSNSFDVLQDAVTVDYGFLASCDQSAQAVKLSVNEAPFTIGGVFSGTYTVNPQNTVIGSDGSGTWTIPAAPVTGPWSFVWRGKIVIDGVNDKTYFKVTQSDGTVLSFGYDDGGQMLDTIPTFSGIGNVQPSNGDDFMVIFTMGATAGTKNVFSWYVVQYDSGGNVAATASGTVTGYTQARPVSVEIFEGTTKYWRVFYGTYNAAIIAAGTSGDYINYYGPNYTFDGGFLPREDTVLQVFVGNYYTIYRQDADGNLTYVMNLGGESFTDGYTLDYSALNGGTYQYVSYFQYSEDDQPTIIRSATVTPCFWSWVLFDQYGQQAYLFRNNVSSGSMVNGNSRSIYNTFTRYPLVMKNTQNRKAGTLTGLIGSVTAGVYSDTNATMNAIYGLSLSNGPLFLRNRRGEILKIALTGEISMDTEDSSPKQQLTASIPWVEIGPVGNGAVGLYVYTGEH